MRLFAYSLIRSLFVVLLLIPASALPLAVAPAAVPPIRVPSCPSLSYPDAEAALADLAVARYDCAEEIAAALRPRAGPGLVDALLAQARSGPHDLARRNALRVLGRFAESPRGSRAYELTRRVRAVAVQATVLDLLQSGRDNFLLQDAVWIVDTFYFPSPSAAPALERVAAEVGLAPALRARAAQARARLIAPRPGPLGAPDRAFLLAGLRSDLPGVRAAAANGAARLRNAQLTPELRGDLGPALAAAWDDEPPLALPADDPPATADEESVAGPLAARAAIARAQDRLSGGTARLDRLRAAYEALALPYVVDLPARGDGVFGFAQGRRWTADAPDPAALSSAVVSPRSPDAIHIRHALPPDELPPLLERMVAVRQAYAAIVGPALAVPIPGEGERPLTVLIFGSRAVYRDYMRAFTPFTVDVDGIYDEASATLYTHRRRADQSENRLEETLQHELAHSLTGRTLFPGGWRLSVYHAEPKGWADEGLAELLAGLELTPDGSQLAPRPRQLARLCARAAPPALAELLALRAGYDQFGRFDYDGAWALIFYLQRERPAGLQRILAAYRAGTYRLADWPQLVGTPSLAQFEAEWHAAIAGWCDR